MVPLNTVAVTGIGILTPEIDGFKLFSGNFLKNGVSGKREVTEVPFPEKLSQREFRRLSKLARMAVYAADQALRMSSVCSENMGLGVALTHGSTSYLADFHDLLFTYGPEGVSPGAFSNGVTNAPLSAISTFCKLTDGGITIIGHENAGLELLSHAAESLGANEYRSYLAGAAEEYSPLVESVYNRLGWYSGNTPEFLPSPDNSSGYSVSEGSAFLVLETLDEKNSSRAICKYNQIELTDRNYNPDIIISGAGGGPQDRLEFDTLDNLLSFCKAEIIFSKQYFGECFALGSLLSSVLACSIIMHGTKVVPAGNLNPCLVGHNTNGEKRIDSVLVLAAARDGQVSAGLFQRV